MPSLDLHVNIHADNDIKGLASNIHASLQELFYQSVAIASLDTFKRKITIIIILKCTKILRLR